MHPLAAQLLKTIRRHRFLRAGDRVAAAVSGGADSIALLRLLLELRSEIGFILSIAHVNHRLRGTDSDDDQRFVADLAQRHSLECHLREAPAKAATADSEPNLEAAARQLRYDFFRQLARDQRASKIATAHTLDDQAETVLLRIFRGAGIRGLAAIHPRIAFQESNSQNSLTRKISNSNAPVQPAAFGEVIRPLLTFRRAHLQNYLRDLHQPWHEDASNLDISFLRNRIRHRLLPAVLADFGDAAIEHLAELAELARAEDEHWTTHAEAEFPAENVTENTSQDSQLATPGSSLVLPLQSLRSLPLATQRRLLRSWFEIAAPNLPISFRIMDQALELADEPVGKKLALSSGIILCGTLDHLRIERESVNHTQSRNGGQAGSADYEYNLPIPGSVSILELGIRIEARFVDVVTVYDLYSDSLLNPALLPSHLVIRNWRAADRYWPAHTKQEKKIKELLTARHATGLEKKLWPVAIAENSIHSDGLLPAASQAVNRSQSTSDIPTPIAATHRIVWMRGFAVPTKFLPTPSSTRAICIREFPLKPESQLMM